MSAPPGFCPRCGSRNLWADEDGHTCLMCGEILWSQPPLTIAELETLPRLGRAIGRCRACGAELRTGDGKRGRGGYVCRDGCA